MTARGIWLTGDPVADGLLSSDDNALLIGMVLDQQVPMEKAFSGPAVIAERMGGRLDVAAIAAMSEEEFVALCSERPAIHRFPGAMAKRVRQVCQVLVADFGGDAGNLWRNAGTGAEVKKALQALPGFGPEKAAIFTAVLAKQRGVQPPGWQEAAGGYGEAGSFRSVADVVDEESLAKVRDSKRAAKAARKAASAEAGGAGAAMDQHG
ncbi:MAG: HhH-GPD-type base excision DNA repair protein [Friedmanniella sp.]